MATSSKKHEIMTFTPTYEEFKDFKSFVSYIESQGAHKAGIAKVIPPKEWTPRKAGYSLDGELGDIIIPSPISQHIVGKKGSYQQASIKRPPITVRAYSEMAHNPTYKTPNFEDLERKYWKNIQFGEPIYGADVLGSLVDPDLDVWNFNKLDTVLDSIKEEYKLDGVLTPYLYFGMWKTTFPWHTEDQDLYSVNYLHFGAPKAWYSIPTEHGKRFESVAASFFPDMSNICPAFLRHKRFIISPSQLKKNAIPYNKITQEAGEIIITFPYGYHAGFNHGFNCAEAINFASVRWVEYGKRALLCRCEKDNVEIKMNTFIKRFQPDRYELWLAGKDNSPHPEDPRSPFLASWPS